MIRIGLCALLLSLGSWAAALAADQAESKPDDDRAAAPQPPTQAQLEEQFGKLMSGATMTGHYTVAGQAADALPKEEKYTLGKVAKVKDDLWLFQVRIQYGDHDVQVPLPIRVKWAGDTPVITLDKVPVPGLGTFSARVVIHDGKYAGTWGGGDHGGLLFGRITPAAKAENDGDAAPAPSKSK
jgi:hypothetical protein